MGRAGGGGILVAELILTGNGENYFTFLDGEMGKRGERDFGGGRAVRLFQFCYFCPFCLLGGFRDFRERRSVFLVCRFLWGGGF